MEEKMKTSQLNDKMQTWEINVWQGAFFLTLVAILICMALGLFDGLSKGELYSVGILIWLLFIEFLKCPSKAHIQKPKNKGRKH